MSQRKKLSFTVRYVLMIGVVLLVANVLLGVISLNRSMTAMKTLINKNMLDIVSSAAGLIDGDALGALTEADVGSEAYERIIEQLTVFQNNVDIEFIYAVRQVSEDKFVFTVDPDPVEPAEFGEDIVVSEGLKSAGAGVAAVDAAPLADKWGSFYSAYSPVFDSSGAVAGVIGVDFDAVWYNNQVKEHTFSIAVTSMLSVLIGGVVIFLITTRVRRKFRELDEGLSGLSANVDRLMEEVVASTGRTPQPPEPVDPRLDEIAVLATKINHMQSDMGVYLEYLRTQAYIDALTKTRSASAYHERLQTLDRKIRDGEARFFVGVFDINSLKEINDNHGHECGDRIIQAAAEAIVSAFGPERTYRIGGDEFAVVAEDLDESDVPSRMDAVDAQAERFNAANADLGAALRISKGMAWFRPGEDTSFREVFARADREMYEKKRAYYQTVGDRRHADRA